MKIAHVVCTYPPYYGGMGNSAYHMAEGLQQRGHDVMVITPAYEEESQPIDSTVDIERIAPSFAYGNAAMIPHLPKVLSEFDLVHLHYPFFGAAGAVKRWKQKHTDIPLVTTYHMDPRGVGLVGIYMKWYARHYMPSVLKASDAIIASTLDFAEASEAAEVYKKNPDKWHALPFGVDTERFHPDAASDTLRYELEATDMPLLLFVGGMDSAHSFKGIPVLLKAIALLKEQGTSVRLALVGDGDRRKEYEMRAHALGIADAVRFLGAVSDDELPTLYATAECTILPSVSTAEAFGMVLLESLASGTPVVASDLPGVRQVAALGGTVAAVNNSDDLATQIAAVLQAPPDMDAVREKIIAEYTWESIVEKLESVYQAVV